MAQNRDVICGISGRLAAKGTGLTLTQQLFELEKRLAALHEDVCKVDERLRRLENYIGPQYTDEPQQRIV